MVKVINEKDGHILYAPMNTWDTNYHLTDNEGNDYLISTDDVARTIEESEEYDIGLMWEDLSTLSDIDNIKDYAWKVIEKDASFGLREAMSRIKIISTN